MLLSGGVKSQMAVNREDLREYETRSGEGRDRGAGEEGGTENEGVVGREDTCWPRWGQ